MSEHEFFSKLETINEKSIQINNSSLMEESKQALLNFLKDQINVANSKDSLLSKVVLTLETRLDDSNVDEISSLTLIRLLEILLKNKTDNSNNILSILKQNVILPILPEKSIDTTISNKEKNIDSTDYKKVKNVLDFIDKIKSSEE